VKSLVIMPAMLICVLGELATAQNSTAIPSWVRPGVVVTYNGFSSFLRGGQPDKSVTVVETTEVISVSGNAVSGISHIRNPSIPLPAQDAKWLSVEGTACSGYFGRFWVDPLHPTDSVKGPNGESFTVKGHGPYSLGGQTWNSTGLTYENPSTGVRYDLTFDADSGLILAYAEVSPAQQAYKFFASIAGANLASPK
jgi:hypothetical protein